MNLSQRCKWEKLCVSGRTQGPKEEKNKRRILACRTEKSGDDCETPRTLSPSCFILLQAVHTGELPLQGSREILKPSRFQAACSDTYL